MVLERAPRGRFPLPPGHGGLRGGQAGRADLRRPGPGRHGCGDLLSEHHGGPQPPGLPTSPGSRRRGGDHRRRAPRQPPPLGAGGHPTLRGVLGCGDLHRGGGGRGPGRRSDPAGAPGGDGRLQCHRMALPDRRRHRGRPPAGGAGGRGRGPVGRAPTPAGRRRLRGLQRTQALCPLRVRGADRAPLPLRDRRSVSGRRWRGGPGGTGRGGVDRTTGPRGGRVAQRHRRGGPPCRHRRPGHRRLGRHRRPRDRTGPAAGGRDRRHRRRTPPGSAWALRGWWPPRSRPCRWRPSRSRACITPSWRRA